jgi:hypothetical protein
MISCTTKREVVYVIIPAPAKAVECPSQNRFTVDFQKADSLFDKASKEAAKAAYEKTKHLIPN